MQKLTEVLSMGGYGAYVWPSYLAAALVMIALIAATLRSLRRSQRQLAELQQSSDQ